MDLVRLHALNPMTEHLAHGTQGNESGDATTREQGEQLFDYRRVLEANDPITVGWRTFMHDFGLDDLIPGLAPVLDPAARDDAEFISYDGQGAFDKYLTLLDWHLARISHLAVATCEYSPTDPDFTHQDHVRKVLYFALWQTHDPWTTNYLQGKEGVDLGRCLHDHAAASVRHVPERWPVGRNRDRAL
jgi:hypothetical protein